MQSRGHQPQGGGGFFILLLRWHAARTLWHPHGGNSLNSYHLSFGIQDAQISRSKVDTDTQTHHLLQRISSHTSNQNSNLRCQNFHLRCQNFHLRCQNFHLTVGTKSFEGGDVNEFIFIDEYVDEFTFVDERTVVDKIGDADAISRKSLCLAP